MAFMSLPGKLVEHFTKWGHPVKRGYLQEVLSERNEQMRFLGSWKRKRCLGSWRHVGRPLGHQPPVSLSARCLSPV